MSAATPLALRTLHRLPSAARLRHLHLLVDAPTAYAQWATAYYERPVSLEAVRLVQEQTPLTPQLIQELNPEITLADLAEPLHQIGFPLT